MKRPTMLTPAERYQAMTHYLRIFYSIEFYRRFGMNHPLLWYRAPEKQQADVDSVLGKWYPAAPQEFPYYDYGHLNSLQNSGRSVYNGTTFILKSMTATPLRINASLGKYFDMLATCGGLERELRDASA